MAKEKKEKREEKLKTKGMLKLKPEKKFKKRKVVNEAAGVNLAMGSKHSLVVAKDTEGLKSVKSGKSTLTKIKKKKLKDKILPKLKSSSEADNEERISGKKEEKAVSPGDDLGNQGESISMSKKKLKKGKKKGKNQIIKKQDIQSKPEERDLKEKKLKESIEMDEENAEEISSVDEDYSRGMKKWLMEYKESRPGMDVLQQRIDDFISDHEAKLEQEKQEREAAAAEGGWTVVAHHKGRKKTTDAESGITVGSVAPAAVLDKMSKKKSKEVTLDFYRFQRRDARRNELMMLQEKFEQDKRRIQELRAARKFRPY
ncbi:ribosomal RNA-processing 7 protein isoform X2 [Carex rostrata]